MANLQQEDVTLDAKFGFDEYDHCALALMREGVVRRERCAAKCLFAQKGGEGRPPP